MDLILLVSNKGVIWVYQVRNSIRPAVEIAIVAVVFAVISFIMGRA